MILLVTGFEVGGCVRILGFGLGLVLGLLRVVGFWEGRVDGVGFFGFWVWRLYVRGTEGVKYLELWVL